MSTTAIIMMILFIVVIWGGLVLSAIALRREPDERTGSFGASPHATDTVLIEQNSPSSCLVGFPHAGGGWTVSTVQGH